MSRWQVGQAPAQAARMDAWETHDNAWRPASPGWDPQDAAEIARLRTREIDLAQAIITHPFWSSLAPGDVLAARDALKHHHEQQMADASS
ncbi:nucleic acid-binding protein [Streptomyces sp. NPDC005574]|uniref:nucleic acid-binding protein n=1 Tax=Streptomyces sp. NPDC005574 TaxID=3156891 RepID=UPI0033B9A43D